MKILAHIFFLFLLDARVFHDLRVAALCCVACAEKIDRFRYQITACHCACMHIICRKRELDFNISVAGSVPPSGRRVETQRHKKRKSSRRKTSREIWDGWENFQVFLSCFFFNCFRVKIGLCKLQLRSSVNQFMSARFWVSNPSITLTLDDINIFSSRSDSPWVWFFVCGTQWNILKFSSHFSSSERGPRVKEKCIKF